MKRIILIILSVIVFWQCNQYKSGSEFVLDKRLAIIVDSFITANPGQKVYELYIDKVSIDSTIIILYSGDQSYTSWDKVTLNSYPLIKISSNNIAVDIYSGIEQYIKNPYINYDSNKIKLKNDDMGGVGCVIFDVNGKIYIDKKYSESPQYPFFPLPHYSTKFTIPNDSCY